MKIIQMKSSKLYSILCIERSRKKDCLKFKQDCKVILTNDSKDIDFFQY